MRGIDAITRAALVAQAQATGGPAGAAGAAAEKFAQVLGNTQISGDRAQLVQSQVSEQVARLESAAAAAEGGRYSGLERPIAAVPGAARELGDTAVHAVENQLDRVQSAEDASHEAMQTLLEGGDIEIHNVMLAAQKAQLELQFAMRLRNKLLEAYQEIMRLPV